jgi:hypothetical protein
MTSQDYGPLTDLVKYSGLLISATGAIGLAWRRKANWEPSEEDLPKGPARVAGLLTAIIIAVIWTQFAFASYRWSIAKAAITLGAASLVCFLVYGYFIARLTYEKQTSVGRNKSKQEKIIGGFELTMDAKEALARVGSIQRLFQGAAYDPDLVWTRESRALARQLFALCYIGLNVCGTLALTCAALLFLLPSQSPR